MPGPQPIHRNVTALIDLIRTIGRGKKIEHNALRFADQQAARTQPQPNLPGGPYCKTTGIYYYARDARREVEPPEVIITAEQLQSGTKPEIKALTPGKVYNPE